MNLIKLCFSFKGRVSRRTFRIYLLCLIMFLCLCYILLWFNYALKPIMVIVAWLTFYIMIPVGAKRLHDTNRPGWLVLVGTVPMIVGAFLDSPLGNVMIFIGSIFIGPYLFFAEGTAGANKYGVSPQEAAEYDSDISECDFALRLNPTDATAYLNRGRAKGGLGQQFGAIDDFDVAIRLRPEYADAYYARGFAKGRLGEHAAALADLDTVICLRPEYANAYYARGLAKNSLGRHQEAIADLDEAIRLNPDYAEAFCMRGYSKGELDQLDAAIVDYDSAIRLNPDYADAYANRGMAKVALQQYRDAIADCDNAIGLDPDYALPVFCRGIAKYKLSRISAAKRDFRTALTLTARAGEVDLHAEIMAQWILLDDEL